MEYHGANNSLLETLTLSNSCMNLTPDYSGKQPTLPEGYQIDRGAEFAAVRLPNGLHSFTAWGHFSEPGIYSTGVAVTCLGIVLLDRSRCCATIGHFGPECIETHLPVLLNEESYDLASLEVYLTGIELFDPKSAFGDPSGTWPMEEATRVRQFVIEALESAGIKRIYAEWNSTEESREIRVQLPEGIVQFCV